MYRVPKFISPFAAVVGCSLQVFPGPTGICQATRPSCLSRPALGSAMGNWLWLSVYCPWLRAGYWRGPMRENSAGLFENSLIFAQLPLCEITQTRNSPSVVWPPRVPCSESWEACFGRPTQASNRLPPTCSRRLLAGMTPVDRTHLMTRKI